MSALKEYVFGLFLLTSLLAVAVPMISYKENGAVKFATGVLVLYAALIPLTSLDLNLDIESLLPEVSTDGAEYETTAKEALEGAIRDAVAKEFSLDAQNVTVELSGFEFEKMRAARVSVTLRGGAIINSYEKIEKFVTALGCGECEVRVEI